MLLNLGHGCWCCCHHYFSRKNVIFNQLLQNFTCKLRIPSVTCAHSFSTTVLPHAENVWVMQNFWSTPSMSTSISVHINLIVRLSESLIIINIRLSLSGISSFKYEWVSRHMNISMRMNYKVNLSESRKISANMMASISECEYWYEFVWVWVWLWVSVLCPSECIRLWVSV